MIPAAVRYARAGSSTEAIALLAEHGSDAKLLAGGHSLVPLMKLRLARPAVLVDIGRVGELAFVREAADHVAIGGLTRHADLVRNAVVREHAPLLGAAAATIGDRQVRHRGTIGGSLAHADPAADLPAVAVALDATFVAEGPDGRREIPARAFFRGFLTTALAPEELLVEVRVPKRAGAGWSFQKFHRRAQDWAIVGVAAWRRGEEAGVALVNMGSAPVLAASVAAALAAGASDADAAEQALAEAAPRDDLHADAAYRAHLARLLVRRALAEAGTA